MSRKRIPIPGETPLFTTPPAGRENQSPRMTTWQEMEGHPENRLRVLAGDNIGPGNSVTERAERLIWAMNALAHRNMLIGFDEAARDSRYKDPIWERYLYGTPYVIDSSQSKADRLLDEATEAFWHATGYSALAGTGLKRGQVRTQTNKMWRSFTHKIGDPSTHKNLEKLRKVQRKALPNNHALQTVKGWRAIRSNISRMA